MRRIIWEREEELAHSEAPVLDDEILGENLDRGFADHRIPEWNKNVAADLASETVH
jgi:hypothetical protein